MAKHPWLDGVVVQGELEMAEKMHVAEVERLRALQAGGAGAGVEAGEAKEQDKVSMEDVIKLGPAVKGMVGMGRI
jgi:serine/threonine-protein kinase SRPK3